MSENKYKFNPETLQYEHSGKSLTKKILNIVFTQLAAASVVAFVIFIIFSYLAETPKQRKLMNENKALEAQYEELMERKKLFDRYVATLKEQDRRIYKTVFEAMPDYEYEKNALEEYSKKSITALSDSNKNDLRTAMETINKQNRELKQIVDLLKKQDKDYNNIPAIQPVYNGNLKKPVYGFGDRIDLLYRTPAFHPGIDYAVAEGTKVYATADGRVKTAAQKRAYGKMVEIDHGNGYTTIYAHLNNFSCYAGKRVKRGELIAETGSTGKSIIPHLHYEVRYNDKPLNPVSYFFMDLDPVKFEKIRYQAAKAGLSMD